MPEPFKSIIPTGGDFPLTPGGAWPEPAPPKTPDTVIAPNSEGVWAPADLKKAIDLQYPSTVHVTHAQTAAPLELPADQAEKAFKDGTATVDSAGIYHVREAGGAVKAVKGADLPTYLEKDAHLLTPADFRAQQLKQEAGSATGFLKTAVQGLGRGLLGGASDTWKTEKEAQEAQNLKEEHPILSGLSEAGGVLAQQALLPGGGLAGAAEEGGSFLARAAGVGGEGAGFLSRAASKALPQALRAGAEGAAIGHAEAISDEALGGGPLTAEKYLATVGSNVLWGAGLGVAGALGSEALSTGGRAVKNAAITKLKGLVGGIEEKFGQPSASLLDGVAEKAFGTKIEGVGKDFLDSTKNPVAGAAARDNVRAAAAADLLDSLGKVQSQVGDLDRAAPVKINVEQVERTPAEINDYVAAHITDKDVQAFINNSSKGIPDSIRYKSVASSASTAANAARTAARETYDAAKAVYDKKVTDEEIKDFVTHVTSPNGHDLDTIHEVHQAVNDYLAATRNLAQELKLPHVASAAEQASKQLESAATKVAKANQVETMLQANAAGNPMMHKAIRSSIESAEPTKDFTKYAIKSGAHAVGAAAGFHFAGGLGGVVGFNAGHDLAKIVDLAILQDGFAKFDKKIAKAVTNFFKRVNDLDTSSTPGVRTGTVGKAAGSLNRNRKIAEQQSTREVYERNANAVQSMVDRSGYVGAAGT